MAEIAGAYPDGTTSVREIAERQSVSAKYLESIVQPLKAAGLIRAVRGMHGGYELTRPPEQISLAEVFRALEGSPAPVPCVDDPSLCGMVEGCPTRDTWVDVKEAIEAVLEGRTLSDLALKCGEGSGDGNDDGEGVESREAIERKGE